MTPRPVPHVVRRRNRLTLATDAAIGLVVISAGLQFVEPGISNLLWGLGCLAAASGIALLRSAIGERALKSAELDEYELRLYMEAREDGLRASTVMSALVIIVAAVVAVLGHTQVTLDGAHVALFFAKLVSCQALWAQFIVVRSLAGKINRDELISRTFQPGTT